MEIKVCLKNRDFNCKNPDKSMFPQKNGYHAMVAVYMNIKVRVVSYKKYSHPCYTLEMLMMMLL